MAIEDFGLNISRLEDLLQKITASMTSGIVLEKLPASELWKRSETDVVNLQGLAKQLKERMLVLKPEKAPTIERRTEALLQPLSSFREILFRKSDDPLGSSRLALEELRRATVEGSGFLELAKEIKTKPSESISTILRLKEVYEAKEYLSAIPVPEAAYQKLAGLKKTMETLKRSVSNLERTLGELNKNLDLVSDEISRFRPSSPEKRERKPAEPETSPEEKASSEPTLVSEDRP